MHIESIQSVERSLSLSISISISPSLDLELELEVDLDLDLSRSLSSIQIFGYQINKYSLHQFCCQ